ncbi:hypothetical protein SRABI26_03710 [Arthrobacter sp. Bi26]|nr:hypothetical protein SRABI26_03710 [Arthrobacter sp. Bi26]
MPGNVPWTASVNDLLNSAGGTTALTFAGGWRFAETVAANRRRTLAGQTLDPTRSGVVTFNLDLTGVATNRVVILVAVIRAGGGEPANDINLQPSTLQELALTRPEVAVRSVRIKK